MHAHKRARATVRALAHASTLRICTRQPDVLARAQVSNPLEPLLMSLVRGFVDDDDLNQKLCALYQVEWDRENRVGCESHSYVGADPK
jgi:hypothetical protein